MIIEFIGIIIILMTIRVVLTQNRHSKLLYINVIDFSISALIALYIKTQLGLILAIIFFITSTISSNALAYAAGYFDDIED